MKSANDLTRDAVSRWAISLVTYFSFALSGAASATPDQSILAVTEQARKLSESKDFSAAAAQWRKATELNPASPEYWKELATALYSAELYKDAIGAYQEAMRLGGDARSHAAYRIAKCFVHLNELPTAEQWLHKAFELGFRYVDDARADEELAPLRSTSSYKALLGVPAPTDRVAGWEHDLEFLVREIRRRSKNPNVVTSAAFQEGLKQLRASISRLTDNDVEFEITRLITLVGDGHSAVFGKPEGTAPRYDLPLLFFEFEEGTFMVASDLQHSELLGSQLVGIGNVKIAEAQKRFVPLISRDNDMWIKQVRPYRLRDLRLLKYLKLAASDREAELQLKMPDGSVRDVMVKGEEGSEIWNVLPYPSSWVGVADHLNAKPLCLRSPGKYYWFKYLDADKVLYFQYNKVLDDKAESLKMFATRLRDYILAHRTDRLVIDMRWNNGGDTFLNEALLEALTQIPRLHRSGAVSLITGRRTFSAAMNATVFFERFLHPLIVGEPTGGKPNSAGDEVPFALPYSKLTVNISDTWWQSSWPYDERNWIAPAIYVPPRFADFKAGEDPALKAAMFTR